MSATQEAAIRPRSYEEVYHTGRKLDMARIYNEPESEPVRPGAVRVAHGAGERFRASNAACERLRERSNRRTGVLVALTILVVALLCLVLASPAWADTVVLRNGARLSGEVVEITPNHWLLRDARDAVHKLPVAGLNAIAFLPRRRGKLSTDSRGPAVAGVPLRVSKGFLQYQTRRGTQFFSLAGLKSLEIGERLVPNRTIDRGGMSLSLAQAAVPGKVTVFVFATANWQVELARRIEALAAADKEVFLRLVRIGNWDSPVAKEHGVKSLPHIRVFDRHCRQVGTVCDNLVRVQRYVRKAKTERLQTSSELAPPDVASSIRAATDGSGTTNSRSIQADGT